MRCTDSNVWRSQLKLHCCPITIDDETCTSVCSFCAYVKLLLLLSQRETVLAVCMCALPVIPVGTVCVNSPRVEGKGTAPPDGKKQHCMWMKAERKRGPRYSWSTYIKSIKHKHVLMVIIY